MSRTNERHLIYQSSSASRAKYERVSSDSAVDGATAVAFSRKVDTSSAQDGAEVSAGADDPNRPAGDPPKDCSSFSAVSVSTRGRAEAVERTVVRRC